MTLLGKLVETSCHQERAQPCKRRQRTLGSGRESELGALQHLTDAHQVNGRRDCFGLQLRLCLSADYSAAERQGWAVRYGGASAPHEWAEAKGLQSCLCASPAWYTTL